MGDDAKAGGAGLPGEEAREAEDREAILGRRSRFIATALSALAIGAAAVQGGCDTEVRRETSSAGGGAGVGGAGGGGADGGGGAGGVPQPCLDVAPPTTTSTSSSGGEGGMPQPCLGAPADGGGGAFVSDEGGVGGLAAVPTPDAKARD